MVIFTNKCKGSFCVESPLYSPFLCEIVKQGGPEAYFDASVSHHYVNAGAGNRKNDAADPIFIKELDCNRSMKIDFLLPEDGL